MNITATLPYLHGGINSSYVDAKQCPAAAISKVSLPTKSGIPIQPGQRVTRMHGGNNSQNFEHVTCLKGFEIEYLGQVTARNTATGDILYLAIFKQEFSGTRGLMVAYVIGGKQHEDCLFFLDVDRFPKIVETDIVDITPTHQTADRS